MLSRAASGIPRLRRVVASIVGCLLSAAAAIADGVAYRVQDIATTPPAPATTPLQPAIPFGPEALLAPAAVRFPELPTGGLWLTDGTAAGTRLLRDLQGNGLREATAIGGGGLLLAHSPATGEELWWTDGTTAGTRFVRDLDPGPSSSMSALVGVLGDVALLAADDGEHGRELWRSDGTPAGTVRFTDLDPGPFSSMPRELAAVGDRLYFSACDPAHGCEPWVTAGSPASTHRLGDIAPGKASSHPEQLTAAARLVFFAADDGTATELWAVPQELFYDGFETGNTIRW